MGSKSYLQRQLPKLYLNIEILSRETMREKGARNLCPVNGFAIKTDIEGIMLTAFATGFALQYCRLMKVWLFYKP